MTASYAGRLLIATPHILDPNFYRSVVLIMEHGEDGALGIVLNRPTKEPLEDHVETWAHMASAPSVVFVGGPVSNEIAVGVAQDPEPVPEGFAPVLDGIGLIDLTTPVEEFDRVSSLRVYAGYSGWMPGQLEAELAEGGWFLADAESGDVFTTEAKGLWRRVMARQPGRLAFYSTFPADPSQN